MHPCIIVDIDGTVADNNHRVHHLQKTPKDWDAFYAEMDKDTPIQYVIDLVKVLRNKYLIFFFSGRPDNYRETTLAWFGKTHLWPDELYMRKAGDHRPDTTIKLEFLKTIHGRGNEPLFAIDDRPEVVHMWRNNGVPCFAVDQVGWYPGWRHKNRGTTYQQGDTARLQTANPSALGDMEEMITYRGTDGQLWVRSALEFHDGRYEKLPKS